jgi:hypothetical protein
LHRFQGDGRISGLQTQPAKSLRTETVGFGSNQPALESPTPEVCAAGLKELTGETAKRLDDLARLAALKSGSRKFQQKLLKRLVRGRRRARDQSRVSSKLRQSAPSDG